MLMDPLFLVTYAAFWFLFGAFSGKHIIPWLVDRWHDRNHGPRGR